MLGWDFFLHAGVLASWYVKPSSFVLSPPDAFVRIPVGYLSFLLLAILLVWMLKKMKAGNGRQGGLLGLMIGGLIWGSFALGLYSISTAPPGLLLGWFIGQSAALGIAGMVAGAGLSGKPLGRLFLQTLGFVVGAILVTIVLQVVGLVPAIKAG